MKKEVRTVVYDDELRIEAYRFEGIVQPFPNHFHEYYVIGFMEDGERVLSCSTPVIIMPVSKAMMERWTTEALTSRKRSCWI